MIVGNLPKLKNSVLNISINGFMKQLASLKPYKASGPDAFPPWFFKEYATKFAPMLANIYQDSIDTGTEPNKWKNANVCVVVKKEIFRPYKLPTDHADQRFIQDPRTYHTESCYETFQTL